MMTWHTRVAREHTRLARCEGFRGSGQRRAARGCPVAQAQGHACGPLCNAALGLVL